MFGDAFGPASYGYGSSGRRQAEIEELQRKQSTHRLEPITDEDAGFATMHSLLSSFADDDLESRLYALEHEPDALSDRAARVEAESAEEEEERVRLEEELRLAEEAVAEAKRLQLEMEEAE